MTLRSKLREQIAFTIYQFSKNVDPMESSTYRGKFKKKKHGGNSIPINLHPSLFPDLCLSCLSQRYLPTVKAPRNCSWEFRPLFPEVQKLKTSAILDTKCWCWIQLVLQVAFWCLTSGNLAVCGKEPGVQKQNSTVISTINFLWYIWDWFPL